MMLRPAEVSDAAALAALSIEVWVYTYLRNGVSSFFADYALRTFTAASFSKAVRAGSETILVSQNTQGIDGFVRLSENRAAPVAGCGTLEISSLYVQPRHHGKGIGAALLRAAIDRACSLGATDVWLTTNAENSPAIRFYLGNGFEKVGEAAFQIQDQGFLNNVYRLQLNPPRDEV
ncbi:GNAT family N-acetyltransferase [Pelagimonas varians]|uniref:Protease synthase and sporulation negative regulatory protein PAI 1 n=1 Tax=Pelagimonas varians TaxID=696760 RepID=A0A238K7Q1_9RHOB|nr:GNAT family N-acetyltransferase [Pelagimonas varians]PYG31660.1 ribosomal protein S18 acetylase RimI-like enzyme [Pelagimonas varians]SMX38835.1 Protease synthase and sporulation negative regulatory protein PAI 1 [Pelagimonas varians]